MEKSFFQQVYDVVKKIPRGKVATFGQLVKILGVPKPCLQVRWALHNNPINSKVPCHRIVNKNGGLFTDNTFGGQEKQRQILECEGLVFNELGRVSLAKYCVKDKDLI